MRFDSSLKRKIAKEAATLLYLGIEKEYKQAKIKAAKTFASRVLPSNSEIALELDKISEEREGEERKQRLVQMRKNALIIMRVLNRFKPTLIGSVWRGTINQNSDIDILVYHNRSKEVLDVLKRNGFNISQTKRVNVSKRGANKSSFHIYLLNSYKQVIEITVRNLDEQFDSNICEIFRDKIIGLKIEDLEKILKKNPHKKFIPIKSN